MVLDFLEYGFVVRGLEAGVVVAILAPAIGMLLVLRRYSLIADTFAHVSLAGVAVGVLVGVNPLLSAIGMTVLSSVLIERLRTSTRVTGESALALFLSGSLALAVVLLSLAKGLNANLLSYLFGSIVTVTARDVTTIAVLAFVVLALLALFFKEFVFMTFDEEAARVAGIPTQRLNALLMVLAALTVSLSIPIVGVLLISALIVVPVVTALLLKKSFIETILLAEFFSLFSVIAGILLSFYFDLSTGGTIVLLMLGIFCVTFLFTSQRRSG